MQRPVLLQYLEETAIINSQIRQIAMDKSYSGKDREKDIYHLQQKKQDMAKEYLEAIGDINDYLTK